MTNNLANDKAENFTQKVESIRELLQHLNIEGILFHEQKNVSWLTASRVYVNMATEKSIASVLITRTITVLICNNIEEKRLSEEEIGLGFDDVFTYFWYQPYDMNEVINRYVKLGEVRVDNTLDSYLRELRTTLNRIDITNIKKLGNDTVEAIERTALQINIGDSEQQIAARLAANCIKEGVEPTLNLVAVDDRVFLHRHPLPTQLTLKKYAMIVVCGRRNGQIVSITRLVHFGSIPEELRRKYEAVVTIDAELISSTRPGVSFSQLFAKLQAVYRKTGFCNEWIDHHQGGLSGYVGREQLLMPNIARTVKVNQIYSWNPSIAGVKSEDTILIGEMYNEIITPTKYFPTINVRVQEETVSRPGILIR